jgi:hypothetical protein
MTNADKASLIGAFVQAWLQPKPEDPPLSLVKELLTLALKRYKEIRNNKFDDDGGLAYQTVMQEVIQSIIEEEDEEPLVQEENKPLPASTPRFTLHGGKGIRYVRAACERQMDYIIDNVVDVDGQGAMETPDGWDLNDVALLQALVTGLSSAIDQKERTK